MMFLIICDEYGCEKQANILQLMGGHVEYSGTMKGVPVVAKSKNVHLCYLHWPEKDETQPRFCTRIKFVWPEDGPPDPPFTGPVPPPIAHWELIFNEESN